jgi:hypothetical protein
MKPLFFVAILSLLITSLLLIYPASAQTQSHPLSEITPIDVNLNMTNATASVFNITGLGWLYYSGGIVFAGNRGISTLDIQDLAVVTSKIAEGAVINSKIASNAVNISQIQQVSCGIGQALNLIGGGSYSCVNLNSTGNVTGTGIINYIPIWNSSNVFGTSVIYQSGSNIGIGTTAPTQTLTVIGNLNVTGASYFGAQSYTNLDASGNLIVGKNLSASVNVLFVDNSTGRVGIGTNSPARLLHVMNGNITVSNDTVPRSDIYWDSTNNRLVIRVS